MRVSDIPVPDIYRESSDFRFFIKWFDAALDKVRFDTENIVYGHRSSELHLQLP